MKGLQPLQIGKKIIRIPIFQGGMGVGVSLSRLAGAVAAAGGVGTLAGVYMGYREKDFDQNPLAANLRAMAGEIKKARAIALGGILAINMMVAMNHYDQHVRQAVDAGIDMIVSGAGLPLRLPQLTQDADVLLAPIVSSARAAALICKSWQKSAARLPDLVIVEGPLAGGHLGFTQEQLTQGTAPPLAQLVAQTSQSLIPWEEQAGRAIPVIAAGGVFDRGDIDQMIACGASGVQMATRFVATPECDADAAFKQAYLQAKEEDIHIIQSPVGLPGRAIRNPFAGRAGQGRIPPTRCSRCLAVCDPRTTPYCISDALMRSVQGDVQNGLIFCGANAARVQKMQTVEEIFAELTAPQAEEEGY